MPAVHAAAILVLLAGLAGTTDSAAQDAADRALAKVTGTIVDAVTGQPLAGVVVMVAGAGVQLESDDAGQFTLTRIPIGSYTLALSHPGYETSLDPFTVLGSGEFATSMEPVAHAADGLLTGISGVVRDGLNGGLLVGATVWTPGAPHWTLTDERGRFNFGDLYPGQHLVQFSYLGYATRVDTIRVEYGRLTSVRVSLFVDPVELDPIEVSVERRQAVLQDEGFYERASKGFGRFLDREQIEKRAPGKMSDLFAGLPGVTLDRDPGTGQRYVMLGGGRLRKCYPRVVLDNIIVAAGGDQPAQIDMLLSRDVVAGVEVYTRSAGVPMRYGGTGSACGVIMIWTGR